MLDAQSHGKVGIALATYNGARYLPEFLSSLLEQSFVGWNVYIRDDHSVDSTPIVLNQYATSDHRFNLILDDHSNLGAKRNFERILETCLSEGCSYIFLADQDDVWDRDKVQLMLNKIREIEADRTDQKALLLHSDLEVVDEYMRPIHRSFMEYQNLDASEATNVKSLLMQNLCTGCAMLLNRAMAAQCLPFGQARLQHDWWISLVASINGEVHYIDRPLVRYRQHSANRIGAKGYWKTYNPLSRSLLQKIAMLRSKMLETIRQADEIYAMAASRSDVEEHDLRCVDLYRNLLRLGSGERVLRLARMRVSPVGFWRGIILYATVATLARRN